MKSLLVALALLAVSPAAHAVNNAKIDLVCWDAKSERGSKPVMSFTAHYNDRELDGATIKDIKFPNQDEEYEYLPRAIRDIFQGEEVTANNSPYKGNYSYDLAKGIRFVLTADVSPAGLKNADVDGRGKGHTAVLDIESSVHKKWSGGSFYIRLRCREAR